MASMPEDLRTRLEDALEGVPVRELTRSVDRLSHRYREGTAAAEPILNSDIDVTAYAGYRMPATYAAIHTALRYAADVAPEFAPATQVDVGGGTGAAVWAAAEIWPSLEKITVLEQVPRAIALGERLAGGARLAAVRETTWRRAAIDTSTALPSADLVTMSYVLGELSPAAREDVVRWLAADAGVVALVEPGTPAGYERVVAARDVLLGLGLTVLAPCPHDGECPIRRGQDWCHFSARLSRSGLHRRIKAATLGFEDEKFAYVIASTQRSRKAENRVLRHPQQRKGLVSLRLCAGEEGMVYVVVSKRQNTLYRAARDVTWGDPWPPLAAE
jgi:ribosomal protein RSM22 (predicted rRNA methylase)